MSLILLPILLLDKPILDKLLISLFKFSFEIVSKIVKLSFFIKSVREVIGNILELNFIKFLEDIFSKIVRILKSFFIYKEIFLNFLKYYFIYDVITSFSLDPNSYSIFLIFLKTF